MKMRNQFPEKPLPFALLLVGCGLFCLASFASAATLIQPGTPISINSTQLNLTASLGETDEAPLLIFQAHSRTAHTYFLRLAHVFESSTLSTRQRFKKINGTELDFEKLQWTIASPPINASRPGIVTVVISALPIPPYNRLDRFDLHISMNTSSALNISTANITSRVEGFIWQSSDPSSALVLLWQMAKFGDDMLDSSHLKHQMEVRSGDAFLKIGSNARSEDRTVLVSAQHASNSKEDDVELDKTDRDEDDLIGTWVIYNHFSNIMVHTSSFGIGEAEGKGGKGDGSKRSLAATIALILGSCILVTLCVLGTVWYTARRRAQQAAIVRY